MAPVDHSGRVGWEGQLSQLADLLETDPESGMKSLGGFLRPMGDWTDDMDRWLSENDPTYPGYKELHDDRNPEFPDPIPNESTVIARAIASTPVDPNDPPRKLTEQEREDLAAEIELDML